MKFDVIGRINNMRLPDGKTAILYSVYEAVSNSIHAINDRFSEATAASKGKVQVDISLDEHDDIDSISVTDNGIGFTPENIHSFETSDSRFKYQRGGKGVGRFIWFKMFETIKVDSVVAKGKSAERVRFTFDPQKENSIVGKRAIQAKKQDQQTTITLADLRADQRGRIRPSSYLKDLALHFFPQYIAGTLPDVEITYKSETASLNEFIADKVEKPVEEIIEVDFGEGKTKLRINHLFVDSSISAGLRNAYLLTAHGRLVGDPVSIERKYALKELPDEKAYVAVVIRDIDGGIVSNIGEHTPFECIIICELTEAARKQFDKSIVQNPTPDGEGYYGYSKPHKAYVKVMSFKKMLRDAEQRNQVFFDALKLGRPSLAAKKRAARKRERQTA